MSKLNALIIDEKDTVAVVIFPVAKGETVAFKDQSGEMKELSARTDIPIYHKIAVREMKKGEPVIKYGEHIGLAAYDIHTGEHVHVHNVQNHRENLQEE